MGDTVIQIDQAENIVKEYLKRFDIEATGYVEGQGKDRVDVLYGSIQYTHPITDRLNASIRAAGVYVHGDNFRVTERTYLGGGLEFEF